MARVPLACTGCAGQSVAQTSRKDAGGAEAREAPDRESPPPPADLSAAGPLGPALVGTAGCVCCRAAAVVSIRRLRAGWRCRRRCWRAAA